MKYPEQKFSEAGGRRLQKATATLNLREKLKTTTADYRDKAQLLSHKSKDLKAKLRPLKPKPNNLTAK